MITYNNTRNYFYVAAINSFPNFMIQWQYSQIRQKAQIRYQPGNCFSRERTPKGRQFKRDGALTMKFGMCNCGNHGQAHSRPVSTDFEGAHIDGEEKNITNKHKLQKKNPKVCETV